MQRELILSVLTEVERGEEMMCTTGGKSFLGGHSALSVTETASLVCHIGSQEGPGW